MNKTALLATALLISSSQMSLAESCHDKFVRLLIEGNKKTPTKTMVIFEPKGGSASKNEFYYRKTGHWMTVMLGAAKSRTLAYDNTMYTSSDDGKTWKKIRTMDSEANEKTSLANLKENAKTVKNAACGEEELDGVMHDTVEAEFEATHGHKAQNHYKYWINQKTGWMTKSVYDSKAKSFSSITTQTMEAVPDLTLPMPK